MNRLIFKYWYLLPLLIIVVFLIDRVEEPADIVTEDTIDMRETQSDYYLSDFVTRKFNAAGNIEYHIRGAALAHYPSDNRSEITMPELTLYRDDIVWHVRSMSGRFDPNPEMFHLRGNVKLERTGDKSEPVLIKTDMLTIATESNQVSTDAPIELASSTWSVKAVGLRSNIDDGNLQLLSDIKGRYQPPFIVPQD